jgi:hypothetical protein
LLPFVAFCCFLLANNHVGAKIRLLRVKTTRLESPELFFCLFVALLLENKNVGTQKTKFYWAKQQYERRLRQAMFLAL